MKKSFCAGVFVVLLGATYSQAQYQSMDYGPFLSATIVSPWPKDNVALRGIAVPFDAPIPDEPEPEGPIGKGKFAKVTGNIEGTGDADLYRTRRVNFNGYKLSVPNGKYKVTLYFCEDKADQGKNVFDIVLQGKKVAEKFDIVDRAGKGKALEMTFENIEVANGRLLLEFARHKGDPSLTALVIEGAKFGRKINCGGPAYKDFAADWPADYEIPTKSGQAAILFDTEMLRYAACWQGGFLTLNGVAFSGSHGANPSPRGDMVIGTKATPGWAKDGDLKDPRPIPHGPLPRDWARYKGLYRHEKGTVFSYSVGACQVLDMPSIEVAGQTRIFCRTLNLTATKEPLVLVVADVEGAKGTVIGGVAQLEKQGKITQAQAIGAPPGTTFEIVDDSRIVLKIPALAKPGRLKLCLTSARTPADAFDIRGLLEKSGPPIDLTPLTRGGKALWTEAVTTQGVRAPDNAAYVVDQITVPFKNPSNSWMRFGGFDFFSDGRAAVCTWSGDVWIVSGIDDKLDKITWKRFASGLFQPLGLKIVDDKIHVLGRDGLMRLHDLNGDGEADFYECLNNDFMVTQNFHEFIFDLHTDPAGNFYFIKGGPVRPGGSGWDKVVPHHGCLMKVAKDGSKLEVVARGFRAPNGMCVGPNGEITCGDNEGTWTPMCPLNWVTPGGFYGVPDFSDRSPKPTIRDNPLCWLPREIDNSNGGQVWITSAKFGPLSGRLLHTSYGTCSLYNVLMEDVAGQKQGGVVPLLKFDSGICRARFNTEQNALFLTGLRGWQTSASKDAGFYRVRYTGKKTYLPVGLNVSPGTIRITFNEPLSKKEAEDVESYNLSEWNYRWTQNYGSPKFKVSNPKAQGHDEMEVENAVLSADGKTVTLKVANLQPVMQMKIAYNLKAVDGTQVRSAIHNTINVVGDQRAELHPGELKIINVPK